MTDWQDITFYIKKQTDEDVHHAITKAFQEAELSPGYATFHPIKGKVIQCEDHDPETVLRVTRLFAQGGRKIRDFEYTFAGEGEEAAIITVSRRARDLYDEVSVGLGKLNQTSAGFPPGSVLRFVLSAKAHLQEVHADQTADTRDLASTISQIQVSFEKENESLKAAFDEQVEQIKALFEERQSTERDGQMNAARALKATNDEAVRGLESKRDECRRERDECKRESQRLAKEHAESVKRIEEDHERDQAATQRKHDIVVAKMEADHEREAGELKNNRERIDGLRKDFRASIKVRSEELGHRFVEYTQPMLIVHLLLLMLFGIFTGVAFFRLTITGLSEEPGAIVAAFTVFFSAAFGLTAASLLRWHRQWRDRHEARELRLQRMSLDVERLYLAVEMALESKSRPGEMSDELLEKLFVKTSPVAD